MPIDEHEYAAAGVPPEPGEPVETQPGERLASDAELKLDVEMKDANPTLLALERIGAALSEMAGAQKLAPEPLVLATRRFRILCMDVLGHLYSEDEATRLADTLIMGVYGGYLGYKQLRSYVFDDDRNKLTAEQRWFALGLCAGFMVDFLPRVRG